MTHIQQFVQNGDIRKKMLDDGTITDVNVMFDNGLTQNTALMYETRYGTIKGMNFLLNHDADPNIQDGNGWTVLHKLVDLGEISKSAKTQQLAKLGVLLQHGTKKSIKTKNGKTALDLAKGKMGCQQCVNVLRLKTLRKKKLNMTKKKIFS